MAEQTDTIRQMVRLIDKTIPGTRILELALCDLRGVGFPMAHAICHVLEIDEKCKVGSLSDEQLQKIEEAIKNPLKFNIPKWMLNRRNDYETGADLHLQGADLTFNVDNDIKRMKKIRCYKGMRHSAGQPVRGQKTRAHFRHGTSLGVTKKKVAPAAASGK
ncbi:MAG TPA: 30S ribosomal protein S13 [Nanoarchaeota archaeon]|nr:30S ribosomal protein S13 [Nanoarchaeota archaeon]